MPRKFPKGREASDTNIPMNIKDDGKIIKKYSSRKLKTIPTELQKYNEYLTKSQPILDEANYVASRRKDKRTKKKEEDFEFIEDLKDKRRAEKSKDKTPTILTDFELVNPKTDLFSNLEGIFPTNNNIEAAKKIQGAIRGKIAKEEQEKNIEAAKKIQGAIRGKITRKREEVDKAFEEAKKEIEKDTEAIKKIQGAIRGKITREEKRKNEIDKAFEKAKKEIEEENAASTIERAILGKVKRERAKKMALALAEGKKALPLAEDKEEKFELTKGPPVLIKRGRPAGTKNKKKK